MTRNILTNTDGSVQTVYNGDPPTDKPWQEIAETEYHAPRDTPTGNTATRYLKTDAETPADGWDAETGAVGVVFDALPSLDTPDTLVNDGQTQATVTVLNQSSEVTMTATLTISDFETTVELAPGESATEQVTTPRAVGETIPVVVETTAGETAAGEIEVVGT